MHWQEMAKSIPIGQSRKILHCGSSPAARISQDGGGLRLHCFRCGDTEYVPHGPRSTAEILAARRATESLAEERSIPKRAIPLNDPLCAPQAQVWVLKTGLTPEEATTTYGMKYDPITRRVCIPLQGGFIARAVFGDNPKYLRAGDIPETYELKHSSALVVVTEDILSAIKVYRAGFSAVAILGTAVGITAGAVIGNYKDVICWTDGDKAGDAAWHKLRRRLALYDSDLHRVRTSDDPKLLHINTIKEKINALQIEPIGRDGC